MSLFLVEESNPKERGTFRPRGESKSVMRYWAYLVGKLIAIAGCRYGIFLAICIPLARAARSSVPTIVSAPLRRTIWASRWRWALLFLLSCGMVYRGYLGSALPLPGLPAPPAHADRDRLLEPHAAIRPAGNRIHLHLRPWTVECGGSANLRVRTIPSGRRNRDDIWTELAGAGQPEKTDGPAIL